MTSYWPASKVMQHLKPEQQFQVMNAVRLGIPRNTMEACHYATSKIPADTTLALIHSEGIGSRHVYLRYPTYEQWMALERDGFVEVWDDFGYVINGLH